ncbi:hypothetical protein SODALDRAFT_361561 [Sodiomyces alkalinus F11]|uniref:Uncharacterized protein n=1 Tax=Sodiomyces alkalinus (strain CBS 110278 / VKM F-3762 / F11) TaxID=1314773 RepID=A0A3N2PQG3_SODAK|nr:hypothetical protein SODALDRAFT_361561 [Sodiomyces alkalinus F11]ROT36742.1 hypothetical protein SODALDRAFT_361561 [Sodiomyces alkalinus F11]
MAERTKPRTISGCSSVSQGWELKSQIWALGIAGFGRSGAPPVSYAQSERKKASFCLFTVHIAYGILFARTQAAITELVSPAAARRMLTEYGTIGNPLVNPVMITVEGDMRWKESPMSLDLRHVEKTHDHSLESSDVLLWTYATIEDTLEACSSVPLTILADTGGPASSPGVKQNHSISTSSKGCSACLHLRGQLRSFQIVKNLQRAVRQLAVLEKLSSNFTSRAVKILHLLFQVNRQRATLFFTSLLLVPAFKLLRILSSGVKFNKLSSSNPQANPALANK